MMGQRHAALNRTAPIGPDELPKGWDPDEWITDWVSFGTPGPFTDS